MSNKLLWLDLEMTGLNPKKCHILQVATIITDFHLNEIVATDFIIWQPKSVLAAISPPIKLMHSQNKLLPKVESSKITLEDVESYIFQLLLKHSHYQNTYLIGNSIHVDRLFLKQHMPLVEKFLHYRQIDISSIKMLCREWFNMSFQSSTKTHTALEDIRQSIEELKYLRDNCFKHL